jgi:peptidyl-prolyl cis-trans isomerase A (cyclophilin A)
VAFLPQEHRSAKTFPPIYKFMKKIFVFSFICFSTIALFGQMKADSAILKMTAPEIFKIRVQTTKGTLLIEATRSWSPAGVDRLYQLVRTGFYNNNSIFRVQTGYVVQFGISDNKMNNDFWEMHPIPDEPVKASNLRGTISYARDGANSRTAQLFINLKDNFKLDTVNYNGLRGFPPVAKIIDGFNVVGSFYSGYGFEPANHQDSITVRGNAYVKSHFPEVDYILSVEVVEK